MHEFKEIEIEWKVLHTYHATVSAPTDLFGQELRDWIAQKLQDGDEIESSEIDEETQIDSIAIVGHSLQNTPLSEIIALIKGDRLP